MAPPGAAVNRIVRTEAARKVLHLAAIAVPVSYRAGAPRARLVIFLLGVTAIALVIEVLRRASPFVGARFDRAFGALLRAGERSGGSATRSVAITGATWLAVSMLAALVLLPPAPAIAALWCVTAGDPAAALFGVWWSSRQRVPGSAKTRAGTAACTIVSFAGVWSLAGFMPAVALAIGITAAIAERYSGSFDDNVTVVALAGFMAYFLGANLPGAYLLR